MLIIVSSSGKNFLSRFEYDAQKDDSEKYCGFYHHSNVLKHKNEKEGVGFIIRTPSLRLLRQET